MNRISSTLRQRLIWMLQFLQVKFSKKLVLFFFFFFMQLAHVATLTRETNSCHLRKTSCCWRRRRLRFTFLWNRSLQLLQRRKPLSHRGGKHKVLDNVLPAHYKKKHILCTAWWCVSSGWVMCERQRRWKRRRLLCVLTVFFWQIMSWKMRREKHI